MFGPSKGRGLWFFAVRKLFHKFGRLATSMDIYIGLDEKTIVDNFRYPRSFFGEPQVDAFDQRRLGEMDPVVLDAPEL